MNSYVTGSTIKTLRESKKLTQAQLADMISVSDKAVSRWETGKGFPDVSLLEPLSKALGISVIELISGDRITNRNVSSNMQRSKFYVCPICSNVIHSMGEALVSCCGITLPCLEAEETDNDHYMNVEYIEDESYITIKHEMTKQHYISFIAYVTSDKIEIKKLYPEGNAESRFFIRGDGELYCYCNHHGLLRTLQQKTLYTYNDSGQVVKVSEGHRNSSAVDTVSEYQYDVLGRRILAVNANGTSEKTEYNAAGLITQLTNYSGPNVISKYEYTYYYDGNQRTKTDESGKTSYVYDDLGRLTEAQLADGTLHKYTFDGNGNRKTMTVTKDGTETITEYVYDLNDRLLSETENGVTTTYSYDNNGNMLGKSNGTSVVTQTFDILNRMTSFSDDETTATYTYNPDNMRRSKTVNGVKTEHIWIGSEIALDITGNSVVSYVQGIKSNYGWYVYNAHGDVVQICDNDGVVTKSYDYDPYGNQLTEVDALDKNPYRYSGEYYDTESGYIYLRARYYDSTTGRFISEDPAFDGFNWYAYCGGNPLNRWDPSGQAWYDWVPGMLMTGAGVAMCATGFGAPAGIGLIAGGTSSLLSSALGAAGFDSELVSMATAGLDVVGGSALLLTPFKAVGVEMICSGFGSLAGGAISESLGGSYELGANIGNLVGGVAGGAAFRGATHFRASRAAKKLMQEDEAKRRVVIGAYDSMSGKIAVAHSGAPIASDGVHPELLNRASKVGEYGEKTIYGNKLGACAEFMSANKLINNGSRVQNIRFTAAYRRKKFIPTCGNCLNVFPEAFKEQKLAKWINNVLI